MNKPMPKPLDDFTRFPFRKLDVRIPRRDLMHQLTQQLHIISQTERANSAFKLSDLGLMEFQQLKTLIPMIIPPYKVRVINETICAQEGKRLLTDLCAADEFTHEALNQFDGKKSIADISHHLAQTTDLTADQCNAYTRGLFLTLVSWGVCRPANTQL